METFKVTITNQVDRTEKEREFVHYHQAINHFAAHCADKNLDNITVGADQREREAGGIGYDYRIELTVATEPEQKRLIGKRNENLLTPEQQRVVMNGLEDRFNDKYVGQDECVDIVCAAYEMGLPMSFVTELYSDLIATWPALEKEVRLTTYFGEITQN